MATGAWLLGSATGFDRLADDPRTEASDNRFALVVMAQLEAKSGASAAGRNSAKLRLVRLMYDRGYSRADILELFRIIDWMIRLPEVLEREFLAEVYAIEEAKKMPPRPCQARAAGPPLPRQPRRQARLGSVRDFVTVAAAEIVDPTRTTAREREGRATHLGPSLAA